MLKFYLLLCVNLLFAQFDWQDNGVPVRQGIHIEWQRTGDVGNDGEMIFAWSDTRYGGRDVYAQKIDQDGNNMWGSEGVPVVIAEGRQEDPILVKDGNGGAFIIWVDYRDEPDYGDIYAQHINSDGLISWDIEGVVLTNQPGKQASPNMASDGIGGAFVIWNDLNASTLGHVYGTHLTVNETDIIAQGIGVPLITSESTESNPSLETAQSGSAVMVWADNRNLNESNIDIYAQRMDVNCNTLWSTPEEGGVPLCTAEGVQEYAKVTYYNEDYSVVVWEDKRFNENVGDIFIQYISMDGQTQLNADDGEALCDHEANQIKPRVKADTNGAYVVWEDSRNGPGDIYVQRHTLDNGAMFEYNGLQVCGAPNTQDQPRLTIDNLGGAYIVWMDERFAPFPQTEVYIQHINADGTVSYIDNGLALCDAPQYQFNPLVRSDSQGNAFGVWGDMRTGSIGLYVQYLDSNGNFSLEENGKESYFGIDGNGLEAKSLYLGNNETMIYWEDHRLGVIADLTYGQKVYNGWESVVDPNGIKLSNNNYQVFPKAEIANSNNDIFLGFGQAFGDIALYYQPLNNDLQMISGQEQGGFPVFESFTPQTRFDLKLSDNNDLYFVFSDQRNFIDNDIYFQKYNDFTSVFSEPVLVVDNFFVDDNVKFITTSPSNDCLIAYDSGDFSGTRAYLTAVDSNGSSSWNSGGLRLSSYESDQFIQGVVETDSGLFIIWKDQRSGSSDIYGQMIDYSGNILGSSDGIAISVAGNDQQDPVLTYNSLEQEVMVCWEDFRSGTNFDVYCSTVDENTLSVSDNFVICDESSNQKSPDVYASLDGSYLFAWEDSRNSVTSNIFYQEMKDNTFVWEMNGVVLCDADFNQFTPQIDLYDESANSYIIFWDDMRSSGKEDLSNIYIQSVTIDSGSSPSCTILDVNNDGVVNVIDIVSTVNIVLGSSPTDQEACAADGNEDGIINVLDIVLLVNYILS